MSIIAVIFDFDDTLIPDSTSLLLQEHKLDPKKFWGKEVKSLIVSGFDPALAYLNLLLKKIGDGKPLGLLTNKDLRKFGAGLEGKLFHGVQELIKDLKKVIKRFKTIDVEFYIISGGLFEIIMGIKFIRDNFSAVYASELVGDSQDGILKYIKRCVTFTEKTRYLFEINKGVDQKQSKRKPYLVNKEIQRHKRRIPIRNMIYIGDGFTDIPCFSLVKAYEGSYYGVFNPKDKKSAKRAIREFLKTKRTMSMNPPEYGKHQGLGSLIRADVVTLCSTIKLEEKRL